MRHPLSKLDRWMRLEPRTNLCRRRSVLRDYEIGRWSVLGRLPRNGQDKSRRAIGHIVEANVAAELPGQAPGDGQAQAGAAARLPAGIERIEHVLALVGGDARAVVFNDQLDIGEW